MGFRCCGGRQLVVMEGGGQTVREREIQRQRRNDEKAKAKLRQLNQLDKEIRAKETKETGGQNEGRGAQREARQRRGAVGSSSSLSGARPRYDVIGVAPKVKGAPASRHGLTTRRTPVRLVAVLFRGEWGSGAPLCSNGACNGVFGRSIGGEAGGRLVYWLD